MKKHLITLMVGLTFSLCTQASQTPTNELKKAIELADKDAVTELAKDIVSLPKDDKEFLLAHAEKWATYRKTIITEDAKVTYRAGLVFMAIGASPFLLFYKNTFCRNLIKKNLSHPLMIIPAIYSAYFLMFGGLLYWIGRSNNNMGCIEQRAHSIVKLIKALKVEDES